MENSELEDMGIPLEYTPANEVYEIATNLSKNRARVKDDRDGVYCPICHIGHVDISKLGKPCPKCGRPLLQFGNI